MPKDITIGGKNVVQIDISTHHLGDNKFEGNPNSQLQQRSEGASYEKSFQLTAAQLPPNILSATLTLSAKGSQYNNPVVLNDIHVGDLIFATDDGSFHNVNFAIDICALKDGNNSIRITSVDDGVGLDDFEFKNIQLELSPLTGTDADDRYLAKLSSVQITDASFRKPLSQIGENGSFWIKARGQGQCKKLKDMAAAMVSAKGADEADRMQVKLVETGPDTSEFRSEKAVLVASLNARQGQTFIVRSGLRGAYIKVKRGAEIRKDRVSLKHDKNTTKELLKAEEESGAEKSKKTEKRSAKKGEKKAGFRTALNRNKTKLIAEKKWLETELKNREKTLNNLGQAKALFIRHYSMQPFPHNKGGSKGGVRKISRLETTENPELSKQEFKLEKTISVLFIRKAKEHLDKEIGNIETDIKRIIKELEGVR